MSSLLRPSLLLLLLATTPAGALVFQTPLEQAAWQVEQRVRACRLRQTIPGVGEAIFEHTGREQRFFLELAADAPAVLQRPGTAKLRAAAPYWNPEREPRSLGVITVAAEGRLVDVGSEQAERLLGGLRDGLAAEVSGQAASGDATVQLVALPVYFQRAWREYDSCVQKLPPPALPQVASKRTAPAAATARPASAAAATEGLVFNFNPGEWQLQSAQRALLESVQQALLADPSLRVTIDGYGNDSYRRLLNLELSRKRAQAVSDLLTAGGVDASRIAVRFHGDEKLSARRVVIRVE
jgi:outer membrane protein OmpA-like peptidoglycan-associated protein